MGELQDRQKRNIRGWYIVLINALVGCGIASSFPQFSMTVTSLSQHTGISTEILMASDTVKSCGIVVAMLVAGFVYNKFGARNTFIYATIATALPQFLLPHTHSVIILMLLKILQGSASVIFPIFLVIILNWIEEKDAGLSTAIFNGVFYSGGGIGGTFAGIVISKSDWIMSFYALGVVQVAIGLIWLFTVKEKPSGNVFEARLADEQAEVAAPALNKKNLLATKKLWLLAISFFATTWSVQAITVDMPLFGEFLGYSEMEIGKILSAVTIGMILSCLVSGKVSDFFAARSTRKDMARLRVLSFGYILMIVSLLLLVFADTTKFMMFYAATFMFTFGASWGLGAFYSILPEVYDEKTVPIVTGITGGIGDMGMPIAPLVVGVMFGVRGFWNIGWISCGVIAALSLLASFALMGMLKNRDNKN